MSKKITDKIKEMLSPEDLKIFESAVQKMVDLKVKLKEEELKSKYDELAEEYVTKKVAEELEVAKATLIEEYDTKLKSIEEKVVTKLGSFLDHVIVEQISEDALEKLAINEIAMPVVEQIKKVFGSNYIDLDTDGSALLKQESRKVSGLQRELSEAHAKLMESEERTEKATTFLLISEKVSGLTESQKQRVVKMFKNKRFDVVKEEIDTFVDMLNESLTPKSKANKKALIDEIISEDDNIEESKAVISEEREEFTYAERANRFLEE